MALRFALPVLFISLLAGCVSTGKVNPMDTRKGRDEARAAYVQLGLGYLKQGNNERAKVPLKRALELDPSDADANSALALVFQAEGEPKLTDEYYRKALSSRSGDARILNNYGGFKFEQKQYDQAWDLFARAANDPLYPERSRVFENLGLTALMLGKRDLALQNLDRALRLNGSQPRALLEMAELAYEDKRYVPARDFYDRFTGISEQNARSLLLGTRLARIFEDRDKAASYGLVLKRLYPGTPEYQQYLSEQR